MVATAETAASTSGSADPAVVILLAVALLLLVFAMATITRGLAPRDLAR
jgi:hypothetical protein